MSHRLRVGFGAALALVLVARAEAGQATCSNPGLPVGAAASSELMPGRLTLNLSTSVLPIRVEQALDEAQGPLVYDTRLVLSETRLAAEYAVAPWLAIGVAMPYRVVGVDVTHRDPRTGMTVPPPASAIHARTETVTGIGDPALVIHGARELGAYRLHVRVGTSLPLGRTVDDPFVLGDIGQEHQHIQLGTGTFVPSAAIEAQRTFARVAVATWALAHLSLYDSATGYRAGHRLSGGATGSASVRDWTLSVAAEAHAETAETWQGVVHEDEGNAGRLDVLAGGGVVWRPVRGLAVVAEVRLPIYSHVTGTQLDYGVVLGLGVAGTLDLRRRRSWRGLDHATAGAAGAAPELTPVPGRLTVFDLWADWCAPCRELDDRLHALARARPGRIAIRKLDVVDSDSAGWKRYLAPGSFDLPHVKVYAADGTLVFERTAPPADLIRAIEAALR